MRLFTRGKVVRFMNKDFKEYGRTVDGGDTTDHSQMIDVP